MGTVTILNETTLKPYTLMGKTAGICYGTPIDSEEKNYKRGKTIAADGHGRVMEYPQVYMILDGYSARVMREFYTHIGGAPTRLQSSTRYIQYGDFDYITPLGLTAEQKVKYDYAMYQISEAYKDMLAMGIKKEDVANILPLGMTTKVVVRTNMRNLIDMSHQRLCSRAYWEFRRLMNDIKNALAAYSDEWNEITEEYFVPKCEVCGFCIEHQSCGRKPKKENS